MHSIGYLYITGLINARKLEHFKITWHYNYTTEEFSNFIMYIR
jgi:hypothetical protein